MRPALTMLLLVSACTVVDAPEDVEELVVYGFEHFDDDEEHLIAVGEGLFPWVDDNFEELTGGYRVEDLSVENLENAGVEDPDIEGVLGAIAGADYRNTLDAVLPILVSGEKDDLFEQVEEFEITEQTDPDCFLAGECDTWTYTATQTVRVRLLGRSTQTWTQTLRWVRPEDGEPFIAGRSLSPQPVEFSTSIVAVDQSYAMFFVYPWNDGARRAEAFWVESRIIGADVPDSFAVTQAANAVVDQAERVDDVLDGNAEE